MLRMSSRRRRRRRHLAQRQKRGLRRCRAPAPSHLHHSADAGFPGTNALNITRINLTLFHTTLVHNGVMASKEKTVRQSVTLPAKVATQVRSMAKRRRLSANRMLIELLEEGLEAQKQKEKAFFELAERFRAADDPKEAERLGEELGQMVFGR